MFGWVSAFLGAVLLILAGVLVFHDVAIKTAAVLAFIGTFGVTGAAKGLLQQGAVVTTNALSGVTQQWVGITAGVGITLALTAIFVLYLHPKKGKRASKATVALGVAVAVFWIAFPGWWSQIAATLPSGGA